MKTLTSTGTFLRQFFSFSRSRLLISATLLGGLASFPAAAGISITAVSTLSATIVGEEVGFDIVIRQFDVLPGMTQDFSFDVLWNDPPLATLFTGSAALLSAPEILDGTIGLGSNCLASIGRRSGRCTLSGTLDDSIGANEAAVSFQVFYSWAPPAGYELCDVFSEGCFEVPNRILVSFDEIEVVGIPSGEVIRTDSEFGTLGVTGIRPIPEPGTSLLISVGLVVLGYRRDGGAPNSRHSRPDSACRLVK